MNVYFDTSVLVKWYVLETDSQAAIALRKRYAPPVPLSPFHRVELVAACRLKVFRGECGSTAATQALSAFQAEVQAGLFRHAEFSLTQLGAQAELLANTLCEPLGVRTLDVIHVATALELRCQEFVTADERQLALAKACHLKVLRL